MFSSVFPVFCIGCQKFNEFLCRDCADSVLIAGEQRREGFSFLSAFNFEGVMADALSLAKDKHQFGYIKVLAKHLQRTLEIDGESTVVVPPSSKAAFRKRGFSPSFEIAKHAGLNVTKYLARAHQTPDQRTLKYGERQSSVQNAFVLKKPGSYLLFDDVVTTGATIREMNRAVVAAGGEVLGILALCSTSTKGANYD